MNLDRFFSDDTAFNNALLSHNFNRAATLLAKVNIEKRDRNGDTCLLRACVRNHVKVFEWLVENCADIKVKNKIGQNVLSLAICFGSLDIVRWLIDRRLLLDTTYQGRYPLHEAVLSKKVEIVKLLVVAGADPDTKTQSGLNAFDLASVDRDKAILIWLITNKSFQILEDDQSEEAKVIALAALFNKYGNHYLNITSFERNLTLAQYAASLKQRKVLEWLKSKHITVDETLLDVTENTESVERFNEALFSHKFDITTNLLPKIDIESQDSNGNTFLMTACIKNDIEAFCWLIAPAGARIDVLDKSGRNLIFIAIQNCSFDIIKYLAGNKQLLHSTYKGQNPLHQAILDNQLDVVKILIDAGIDPYLCNDKEATAFDLALEQADKTVLKWLLTNTSFKIVSETASEEAKIDALEKLFNKYGYQHLNIKSIEKNLTIAEYAANTEQIEILIWLRSQNISVDPKLFFDGFEKALFNHKFDIASKLLFNDNIKEPYYYTLLVKTSIRNEVKVFEWLVKHGADIHIQDNSGRNVLFIAITYNSLEIVKWLANESQLLHTTYKGQTPLHAAVSNKQFDVVKLLMAKGLDPYLQDHDNANIFDIAQKLSDKTILKWLLTKKSFDALDESRDGDAVAVLEQLFDKYGYDYLNLQSVEKNLTIAEYAAEIKQIEVLKWLKSKNVPVDETLLLSSVPVTDEKIFAKALFSHKFDIASNLLPKVNIETRDYNGNTYLLKACVKNDLEVFEWLLRNGADINAQSKSGRNAIFNAIEVHSLDIIKWLINDKRLLATTYKGQNALDAAILENQLDVVKLLVVAGINPYDKDIHGDCAFDLSHKLVDKTISEWLSTNTSFKSLEDPQRGELNVADLEKQHLNSTMYGGSVVKDQSGEKPCETTQPVPLLQDLFNKNRHLYPDATQMEIEHFLISKSVSVDKTSLPTTTPDTDVKAFEEALFNHNFDVASKLLSKINIETPDCNENTYLMKACVQNKAKVFDWLIQHKANIDVKDKAGRNLLFMAINSDSLDIVKYLIEKKQFLGTLYKGRSPLHETTSDNRLPMLKLLVSAGRNPDIECKMNVFDLAQAQSNKAAIEWLLTNRSFEILDNTQPEEAKINALENLFEKYDYQYLNLFFDKRNLTITQYAQKMQQTEVLKWLKSKCIPVEEPSFCVNTTNTDVKLFEEALFKQNFDVASDLIRKIDIETPDYNGNTYLMKACVQNNGEVFDWLIKHGAKVEVEDKFGKNPLFMAIEAQSLDIVKRLIDDKRLLHTTYKDQTPLHEAVLLNQLGMVKLLVVAGLDPNVQGRSKANAFDMAQTQTDESILEWLLMNRAFEILDADQSEETKIDLLNDLFSKYGDEYLNATFAGNDLTIAEYAATTEQVNVLKWLKSKNVQMPDAVTYDFCVDVTNPNEKPINILLLGETGAGKSSAINALMNYMNFKSLDQAVNSEIICSPIPSHFVITDANFQPHDIRYGSDINESEIPGASSTQAAKDHFLKYDNLTIRFIDTPGIGDTRGINTDDENFQKLLRHIGELKDIHGICIVLKPNNARLNVLFEYCIKGLLSRLHKNASQNIVFLFTNSRSTFYKPGDTIVPLQEILRQMESNFPYISIPLNKDNVFCLDNEAFRYLIATRKTNITFSDEEKNNFRESWTISAEVCKRFLNYMKSLKPHKTQETVSYNKDDRRISRLGMVLAETTRCILMNIRRNARYVKGLMDFSKSPNEIKQFLAVPTINLKIATLPYPATVCTNQKCAEITRIEGVAQKNYTKSCHSPCYLKGVSKEVIGDPALSRCCVMEDKNGTIICKRDSCGHHLNEHIHIEYIVEFQNVAVQRQIDIHSTSITNIRNAKVTQLEGIIKEYEEEIEIIQKYMAEFAFFLKNNSAMGYSDPYEKYMESLVNSEKRTTDADNEDVIERYEQLISSYKRHRKAFETHVTQIDKAKKKAIVDGKFLTKRLETLYKLRRTGNTIKELHTNAK